MIHPFDMTRHHPRCGSDCALRRHATVADRDAAGDGGQVADERSDRRDRRPAHQLSRVVGSRRHRSPADCASWESSAAIGWRSVLAMDSIGALAFWGATDVRRDRRAREHALQRARSRIRHDRFRLEVRLPAGAAAAGWGAVCGGGLTQPDVAAIFYTSGTTGFPKGAMTTHEGFLSNIETCHRVAASPRDGSVRSLVSVPLFHVTGCNSQLLPCCGVGRHDRDHAAVRRAGVFCAPSRRSASIR